MRTTLIPILLFAITTLLYSCQKELTGDPDPTPAGADSAWYLSSIRSIDYDSAGTLIDSTEEYYTYQDGKTIYKNVGHDFRFSPTVDSSQYTYYYDQDKRLTKFNYDYNSDPFLSFDNIKSIIFTYPANNSVQADITWGNNDIQRDYFSYSNGNKVLTIYDTIPRFSGDHTTYTIYQGTGSRVDSLKAVTVVAGPPDDMYISMERFTYDAQNNLASATDISVGDAPAFDSLIVLSRETKGTEINNTFEKVLANMRWYPLLLDYAFYSIGYSFVYIRYPMLSGKRWSRDINQELTIFDTPLLFNGNFINTFDSNNLLVHQEIPGGFANKYGGRASFQFTYIKLPK